MSDETLMSSETPTTPADRPPRFALNMRWRLASEAIWFVVALLVLIVLFAVNLLIMNGNPRMMANVIRRALPIALVLPPTVLIMASGGLDLSVVGVSVLAALFVGRAAEGGAPLMVGVAGALAIAFVVGLLHALLVGLVRINGVIVTLGSGTALQLLAASGSVQPAMAGDAARVLGEGPGSVLLWLAALLAIGITALLLYLTPFGRRPQPGDDRQEGRLARLLFVGLPYLFSSLMAALAGFAVLGIYRAVVPGATTFLLIDVLLAALIAGTPFGLGYGNVIAGIPALLAASQLDMTASALELMSEVRMRYLPGLAVVVFALLAHLFANGVGVLYARRGAPEEPAADEG
jgi:ribose transport system permease protein